MCLSGAVYERFWSAPLPGAPGFFASATSEDPADAAAGLAAFLAARPEVRELTVVAGCVGREVVEKSPENGRWTRVGDTWTVDAARDLPRNLRRLEIAVHDTNIPRVVLDLGAAEFPDLEELAVGGCAEIRLPPDAGASFPSLRSLSNISARSFESFGRTCPARVPPWAVPGPAMNRCWVVAHVAANSDRAQLDEIPDSAPFIELAALVAGRGGRLAISAPVGQHAAGFVEEIAALEARPGFSELYAVASPLNYGYEILAADPFFRCLASDGKLTVDCDGSDGWPPAASAEAAPGPAPAGTLLALGSLEGRRAGPLPEQHRGATRLLVVAGNSRLRVLDRLIDPERAGVPALPAVEELTVLVYGADDMSDLAHELIEEGTQTFSFEGAPKQAPRLRSLKLDADTVSGDDPSLYMTGFAVDGRGLAACPDLRRVEVCCTLRLSGIAGPLPWTALGATVRRAGALRRIAEKCPALEEATLSLLPYSCCQPLRPFAGADLAPLFANGRGWKRLDLLVFELEEAAPDKAGIRAAFAAARAAGQIERGSLSFAAFSDEGRWR